MPFSPVSETRRHPARSLPTPAPARPRRVSFFVCLQVTDFQSFIRHRIENAIACACWEAFSTLPSVPYRHSSYMKQTLLILSLLSAGVASAADAQTYTTVHVDLNETLTISDKFGTSFMSGENTTAAKLQTWLAGTSGWQSCALNGGNYTILNGASAPAAVGETDVKVDFIHRTNQGGSQFGSEFTLSDSDIDKADVRSLTLNFSFDNFDTTAKYYVALVYQVDNVWTMSPTGDVEFSEAASNSLTVTNLKGLSSDKFYIFTKTWGDNWAHPQLNLAMTASVAVPEPATATLSLLALAGLAARRRRK